MSDQPAPNPTPPAEPQGVLPPFVRWARPCGPDESVREARPVGLHVARPVWPEPDGVEPQTHFGPLPLSRRRAGLEILAVVLAIAGGLLFTAVGLGLLGNLLGREVTAGWINVIATGGGALCGVLTVIALVRLGGRPLASIGLRTDRAGREAALGLGLMIATFGVILMGGIVAVLLKPELMDHPSQAQEALRQNLPDINFPGMVVLMIAVALWEEIIFRGFLLTRLQAVFRRWWLSLLVGTALFASGHIYQGPVAVAVIGGVGLVLGGLFIWRKSLVGPLVFHVVFNVINLSLLKHVAT